MRWGGVSGSTVFGTGKRCRFLAVVSWAEAAKKSNVASLSTSTFPVLPLGEILAWELGCLVPSSFADKHSCVKMTWNWSDRASYSPWHSSNRFPWSVKKYCGFRIFLVFTMFVFLRLSPQSEKKTCSHTDRHLELKINKFPWKKWMKYEELSGNLCVAGNFCFC